MTTTNERLLDAAIHRAIDLSQYSEGVVRRLVALLNRADSDLFAALTAALDRLPPDSFTVARLEALLASVRAINESAYGGVSAELMAQMRGLAAAEVTHQVALFASAVPAEVLARFPMSLVTAEQAYAAAMSRPFQGRLLSEWAASIADDRMRRIREAIRVGYVSNETNAQIVGRIRGTRALRYSDGIIEADRRTLRSVVNTAVSHTAATARGEVYGANADLIKAEAWVSTLDSRTTHTCFPASTPVLPVGDLQCVTSRWFDGELILVTTASGKQLRATPNHPVLTARGWCPIKELSPRDDVLYRVARNVGDVIGAEDVEMPATIGALFDAISQPAVGEIFGECATEAQFHGDGVIGENEIKIARPHGNLRDAAYAFGGEKVVEPLFRCVHDGAALLGDGLRDALLKCLWGGRQSAPALTVSAEHGIQAALADIEASKERCGGLAGRKGGDYRALIGAAHLFTTSECPHRAGALEDSCDCGGCDPVSESYGAGAGALRVFADDVVSVEREFFTGHVFNLSTSHEVYIANGLIVHNCQARDGKRYTPITHQPIGHDYPWLGGPGRAHWGCRSTSVAITKSWKELSGADVPEFSPATRASMDGQIPAEQVYSEWLKRQSAARQDEILGDTRGAMMRSGGLAWDQMFDRRGKWLTLEQLRERGTIQ